MRNALPRDRTAAITAESGGWPKAEVDFIDRLVYNRSEISENMTERQEKGWTCLKEKQPAGQIDFAEGSVRRKTLALAAPMLIAQVLNLLYNIVDRIYIGKIPGEGTAALAGLGLCFPVVTIVTAFANLFGAGGAPLCSIARGKGNRESAQSIMRNAYFMLLVSGAVLTAVGLVFHRPLLYLFGASDATYPYAASYLTVYLLGTLCVMTSLGLNPYINCQGFAKIGMLTVVVGAAANIVLDPVLIFVLHLGVRGAAIATVISQMLSALWVLRFLTGQAGGAKNRLPRLSAGLRLHPAHRDARRFELCDVVHGQPRADRVQRDAAHVRRRYLYQRHDRAEFRAADRADAGHGDRRRRDGGHQLQLRREGLQPRCAAPSAS